MRNFLSKHFACYIPSILLRFLKLMTYLLHFWFHSSKPSIPFQPPNILRTSGLTWRRSGVSQRQSGWMQLLIAYKSCANQAPSIFLNTLTASPSKNSKPFPIWKTYRSCTSFNGYEDNLRFFTIWNIICAARNRISCFHVFKISSFWNYDNQEFINFWRFSITHSI